MDPSPSGMPAGLPAGLPPGITGPNGVVGMPEGFDPSSIPPEIKAMIMATTGMCPNPPGVTSNFGPDSDFIGTRIIVVFSIFAFISTLFLFLRLYTRVFITRAWGAEDIFITFAWACSMGAGITNSLTTRVGLGRHCWDVSLKQLVEGGTVKMIFSANVVSCAANAFAKISVLWLLVRIASHRRDMRIIYYVLMGLALAYNAGTAIAFALACTPFEAQWDPTLGSCIDRQKIFVPNGICDLIVSVLIFLAPFPLIFRTAKRLPKPQLVAIILIMIVGSITWIVSVARLASTIRQGANVDILYNVVEIVNWWNIELHLSIFCASAFCLRSFIQHHFPNLPGFSTHGASSHPNSGFHLKDRSKSGSHVLHSQSGISTKVSAVRSPYAESDSELVGDSESGSFNESRMKSEGGGIHVDRTWDVHVAERDGRL